jgi:hypothetical protein
MDKVRKPSNSGQEITRFEELVDKSPLLLKSTLQSAVASLNKQTNQLLYCPSFQDTIQYILISVSVPRQPRFDPRSEHMRFVADKVAL